MGLIFKEITESTFENCSFPILFNDAQTDRMFGLFSLNNYGYKFGWQSMISKPKLDNIIKDIYSVGIDQNFAIVNLSNLNLILKLNLNYFFYDIRIHGNFIYVITELEIIKISKVTFEVKMEYELPDFFEEIEFKYNEVTIKCSGGKSLLL